MRFSLRDLFWLVLLAAVGCAWWIDRERQREAAQHDREIVAGFQAAGVDVQALLAAINNSGPPTRIVPHNAGSPPPTIFPPQADFQAPPRKPQSEPGLPIR